MELSVIIVNFNTKDLIRTCLDSIRTWSGGSEWEIIVVDNGSTDGSAQMLKKIKGIIVIQNKENEGFAKANNRGIKIAKGKNILLLNSDTEIRENAIQSMLRFMDDHPKAGAATCRLELPSGAMDPACHRGFPTPWASFSYQFKLERVFPASRIFGQYHMQYKEMTNPHQVDCISGAFFLIRRETIDDVGLLDEDYFMYAEDIDWAYRIKQRGWEVWFNPEVSILHKKKQSGRSHESRPQQVKSSIYFFTSNWLFYKKHYQKKYGIFVTMLVNVFYTVRLFFLKQFSI